MKLVSILTKSYAEFHSTGHLPDPSASPRAAGGSISFPRSSLLTAPFAAEAEAVLVLLSLPLDASAALLAVSVSEWGAECR